MRTLRITASLGALALLGGCSKGTDARPDDALKTDLALAAQAQPYQAQQFVSPAEQRYGANGMPLPTNAYTPNAAGAPGAVYTPSPTMTRRSSAPVSRAPARRTSTRSSSGSSGSSRSSGGYSYPSAPAPRPVVKHTKRDAAIGAGAGAVIGAVTSRDKLKGGIIGAAAGAILGGVIGNNVDIQRP
jgi:hypothetical protein